MKTLFLAISVSTSVTSLSHAADLGPAPAAPPSRSADFAPPSAAPRVTPYNWSGCYLGVSLGGAFANGKNRVSVAGQQADGATTFGGGIGGGQAGCNYQVGNAVYGIEVDGQAAIPLDQFGTAITPLGAVTNVLPAFGTLRGRLGYAPVDGVMLYVTGGGGVAEIVTALTQGSADNPITQVSKQVRGLWTVGAGIETALYANWTVKVEYLYLETATTSNFNIQGIPSTVNTRLNDNIVRVGVNYRF